MCTALKAEVLETNSSGRSFITAKVIARYDESRQMLRIMWHGAATLEEIKAGYKLVMDLVRQHKPKRWLLNVQERELIMWDDRQWAIRNIFPEVLQVMKEDVFVAIIMPDFSYYSLGNDLNGDELMLGDSFVIMDHFLYEEEGERWLERICAVNSVPASN